MRNSQVLTTLNNIPVNLYATFTQTQHTRTVLSQWKSAVWRHQQPHCNSHFFYSLISLKSILCECFMVARYSWQFSAGVTEVRLFTFQPVKSRLSPAAARSYSLSLTLSLSLCSISLSLTPFLCQTLSSSHCICVYGSSFPLTWLLSLFLSAQSLLSLSH